MSSASAACAFGVRLQNIITQIEVYIHTTLSGLRLGFRVWVKVGECILVALKHSKLKSHETLFVLLFLYTYLLAAFEETINHKGVGASRGHQC